METRDCSVDDLDIMLDIRTRSFGPMPDGHQREWLAMQEQAAAGGRLLGVFDKNRLVAAARINPFRQWWHGRVLPMAGVGGVVVAPEYRGRGVGTQLMSAILVRARELGYPLSALYPAAVPPYRALGWERVGRQHIVTMPGEALRTMTPAEPVVDVHRAGRDAASDVQSILGELHERHRDLGPFQWPLDDVADWLGDEELFGYLAHDGFVAYRWEGSNELSVEYLVGGSEETLRTLWRLVGSGSSIARTVRVSVQPDDPVVHLVRNLDVQPDREFWWMLRLLDAPAAFEGRGYPAGVELDVPITVTDTQVADNTGNWILTVSNGKGRLVPGRHPGIELDARGLAALYAGTRVHTLRRAGLAAGGGEPVDGLLDAAFSGTAFMLEYF